MEYRVAHNSINFVDYRNELIDILVDPETTIFLDTNMLSQMFKMRHPARSEFYAWIEANISRIHLPHWAYNEYMKRAVDSVKLKEFYPVRLSTISKEFLEQSQLLAFLADDKKAQRVGLASTTELVDRLQQTADFLSRLDTAFRTNEEIDDIRSEINRFILDIKLPMVVELTQDLLSEFATRVENQIPPGFAETKESNRIGDFIIWLEMLGYVRGCSNPRVIFLTNDKKADWQYLPQKVEYNGRLLGNQKNRLPIPLPLKLADPRLVSEFYQVSSSDKLYIFGFEMLAHCLSEMAPDQFRALRNSGEQHEDSGTQAGPQVDTELDPTQAETSEASSTPPVQQQLSNPEVAASFLQLTDYAVSDSIPHTSSVQAYNDVIEKLKSYTWSTQSSGVSSARGLPLQDLTRDERFILGRNFYQTACGSEWDASRIVSSPTTFRSHFRNSPHLDDVVQGMLFEVYFDSRGNLRTQFKNAYLDELFKYRTEYSVTFSKVGELLRQLTNQLLYVPGDPEMRFDFVLTGSNAERGFIVTSLTVNGLEILADAEPSFDPLSSYYIYQYLDIFRPFTNTDEARSVFSTKFMIPEELTFVRTSETPIGSIRVSRDKVVRINLT